MSTCDACTHPGACCSGFAIVGHTFPIATWQESANKFTSEYGVPFFKAIRIHTETKNSQWRAGFVGVRFNCELLGTDGRCTDYENRPRTCIDFKAGSDPLCAMYEFKLKAIPIRVQR